VPGAVSGRFSAAFDDSDFFIDAAFMPAEVIAPAARGDEKSEKPSSTAAIKGLQAFLKDGTVADVAAQPFASTTLDTAPTSKEIIISATTEYFGRRFCVDNVLWISRSQSCRHPSWRRINRRKVSLFIRRTKVWSNYCV
jgi:hypothetical protein